MVRFTPGLTIGSALVALTACSPDRVAAPVETSAAARPLSLIGDVPANHLIGETPTITYSAVDGGFTIRAAVNAGLLKATQRGQANFAIATRFTLVGDGSDGIVVVGGCPMSDIKAGLADPRPDPFIEIEFFVPWDGKDSDGKAMTGTVGVTYSIGVVQTGAVFEPNNDEMLGTGHPVTGFFDITIVPPGGNLQ